MKSVADLDRHNKRFWKAQHWLVGKRIGVSEIAAAADALVQDEIKRGVPVGYRRSYELALRDAAVAIRAAMTAIKRGASRKAGSAKKGDQLTLLIRPIVAKHPEITLTELKKQLLAHQYFKGVIDVSEEEILIEVKKGKRNQTISFPLSGLKDRLSRAKKEVRLAKSR